MSLISYCAFSLCLVKLCRIETCPLKHAIEALAVLVCIGQTEHRAIRPLPKLYISRVKRGDETEQKKRWHHLSSGLPRGEHVPYHACALYRQAALLPEDEILSLDRRLLQGNRTGMDRTSSIAFRGVLSSMP